MTTLDEQVAAAEQDGFTVVQSGRITCPHEPRLAFSDRAEGFDIHQLGRYGPPTWRSQYENRLYDDAERWFHLRRPAEPTTARTP